MSKEKEKEKTKKVCPECGSKKLRYAVYTDHVECSKCLNFWEEVKE